MECNKDFEHCSNERKTYMLEKNWNFHELPNLPGLTTHAIWVSTRSLPKMFPVFPCQPLCCFQSSPTGIGFYEFLVHARRVREQQLQLVAQEVEAICCDTKTCLLEDRAVGCWLWCTQGTKTDIMLVLLWYINCKEFMRAYFFWFESFSFASKRCGTPGEMKYAQGLGDSNGIYWDFLKVNVFSNILLMVQKSGDHHLGCIKPCK